MASSVDLGVDLGFELAASTYRCLRPLAADLDWTYFPAGEYQAEPQKEGNLP